MLLFSWWKNGMLVWSQNVHCCVEKSHFLRQLKPCYTFTHCFSKTSFLNHFRVDLVFLFFSFLHVSIQNFIHVFHFLHICCMLHLSRPTWFNHPDSVRWWVQIMKLLIMWFSPILCYSNFPEINLLKTPTCSVFIFIWTFVTLS